MQIITHTIVRQNMMQPGKIGMWGYASWDNCMAYLKSENLTLLIELSYFGILCKKLFVLTLWIHLRIDWINFGKTKKFCTILKLTLYRESKSS